MDKPGEATELDCGSERDKKFEEEAIEEDEQHDEAEEESDDDDCFFESLDRVPSGVSLDLDHPSSGSDSDEDENEVRVSFASAMEAPRFSICVADLDDYFHDDIDGTGGFDYGIWMAEPVSLTERRRRLFQGMGLTSRKDLAPSKSRRNPNPSSNLFPPPLPPSSATAKPSPSAPAPPPSPPKHASLARSLSDCMPFQAPVAAGLVRSLSSPPSPWLRRNTANNGGAFGAKAQGKKERGAVEADGVEAGAGTCKIKNLDTGKEFVVSEVGKDGTCGRLNDVQSGLQLTMDEFEQFLGFSPIVKELMCRVSLGEDKKNGGGNSNSTRQGYSGKSSKSRARKRGSWLKNIKFVASSVTGLISEKERYHGVSAASVSGRGFGSGKSLSSNWNSSDWLKVHQHGKSYKELTGLYMCQEIQAHQGSIWCMRFSSDGRFLASAGEDRTVHVWQVMESNTLSTFSSLRRQESRLSSAAPGQNMSSSSSMEQAAILGSHASKRTRKKCKLGRKRSLPDYVVLPDTMFSISETPFCSFEGHLDDVLDISWSKSQHLLSSSMDKTVRLWDMESKACLKLFAHNDYVTCIQFNPMDDNYFISGSLDGKVRIWSIPNRQVVDWSDLHEMVTAVCYTPGGQGALVGTHKGSFRSYNISDDKISQESQIDISHKKKKSHARKITGFQYAPDNSSQVMVTSAGSQILVFDGIHIIHKFRGFRNTSSQISASFSSDGKYIVCASEDSNVYIWKRDTAQSAGGGGKSKVWVSTRSHEYFYCKDVSVAIPWPNNGSNSEKPTLPSPFSRNLGASNRSQQSTYSVDDALPKKGSSEQVLPSNSDTVQASSSHAASVLSNSSSLRSLRSANSSSLSSSFASWGWGGGSNKVASSSLESSNAWGLVFVTAGLEGNIRIYQNFGLPVRLSRQNNLF